jgi:toxin ParE1/3/4
MAILRQLKAIEDLEGISDYLSERNVSVALRFLEAVEESFRFLERFPLSGRGCRFRSPDLSNVRKRIVHDFRRYVIYYRPVENGVEILRVVHGARDTRALLGEEFE